LLKSECKGNKKELYRQTFSVEIMPWQLTHTRMPMPQDRSFALENSKKPRFQWDQTGG
jgi:hypothetical protein